MHKNRQKSTKNLRLLLYNINSTVMIRLFISLFLIFIILSNSSCAKRGTITGGLKDSIAPKLIRSIPINFSTNFTGTEVKLYFDEYIKVKDVSKQLIVSPPMNKAVDVSPQNASKILTIKIIDTLLPNTTYSFNFGESIQDNNEGNTLRQFKYVFSTGKSIDTLSISGTIKDALEKKQDNFVSVMLYEINDKFNDSIVYKQKPRYVTNTSDSLKVWKIDNIKAGKYKLIALKDNNNNLQFDPKNEKIAFHSQPITIPTNENFELKLFKEKSSFKAVKATQVSANRIILSYNGIANNSKIKLKNGSSELKTTVTKLATKDSLQVWFTKIQTDSLQLDYEQNNYKKSFNVKIKDLKKDTLSINSLLSGNLKFRADFELILSTPLAKFDKSKMLLLNKDSISVDFTVIDDNFNQKLRIDFVKDERQDYKFKIEPGAINDFFDNQNKKAQTFKFSTDATTDYGNMNLKLENVPQYPLIVELVDEAGKILATAYTEKDPFVKFDLIEPASFILRVIQDENKNKKWDEGNYLLGRQPEKVFYFPNNIPVRANWDVNERFDLGKK